MNFQKLTGWIAGNDDLNEIIRIYNIASFIAMLFCLMAAIESTFARLNPILIANNFCYSFILALSFYLSRFKHKFDISRNISVFVLLFIYTPILWIYNGGSASGIPYYIILFASFLIILSISYKNSHSKKTINFYILIIYSFIVTGLVLLELFFPQLFYKFDNQPARYFDMIVSMLFALVGNYFILRAFIGLYYKQLDQINEYSERLEKLVVRDSMTNLYNHAFIITRLSEEINKCVRYHSPLSILMIDIDHFKHINDTYGHAFGDEVLIKIAQSIQSSCRNVDIVARYGGEEFLVVLPETNSASAFILSNRITRIIHNVQFKQEIIVTISGGITAYIDGDTTSTLIERSDLLLYEAKKEGRDRIKLENG
jgi:diguanylate cyclase (GGDEF)-like protein